MAAEAASPRSERGWCGGGEDGAGGRRGRRGGAVAADERAGDPAGDGAGAAGGPARVHVGALLPALPGVGVPPAVRRRAGGRRRAPVRAEATPRGGGVGLPLTHFVRQLAHHLAATLVASVVSFPATFTLLLAARAAAAYAVAAVYAGKPLLAGAELSSSRAARSRPRRHVRARVRRRHRLPLLLPRSPRHRVFHAQVHALPARHRRLRRPPHRSCLLRGVRAHHHSVQPRRCHRRS